MKILSGRGKTYLNMRGVKKSFRFSCNIDSATYIIVNFLRTRKPNARLMRQLKRVILFLNNSVRFHSVSFDIADPDLATQRSGFTSLLFVQVVLASFKTAHFIIKSVLISNLGTLISASSTHEPLMHNSVAAYVSSSIDS